MLLLKYLKINIFSVSVNSHSQNNLSKKDYSKTRMDQQQYRQYSKPIFSNRKLEITRCNKDNNVRPLKFNNITEHRHYWENVNQNLTQNQSNDEICYSEQKRRALISLAKIQSIDARKHFLEGHKAFLQRAITESIQLPNNLIELPRNFHRPCNYSMAAGSEMIIPFITKLIP